MEEFSWYKGFGIRYYQITGTTEVESSGFPIKRFVGKGCLKGKKHAKEYVDKINEKVA